MVNDIKYCYCDLCNTNIDVFGDHGVQCIEGGDVHQKHDMVVELISQLLDEAGFEHKVEVKGLDMNSAKRSADIYVYNYDGDKDCCFDVGIANALKSSTLIDTAKNRLFEAKQLYKHKVDKYEKLNVDYFIPLIWEEI